MYAKQSTIHNRNGGYPGMASRADNRRSNRWFIWPLTCLMAILPAAILLRARSADLPGLMISYLNVLVIGSAMIYFIRQRTFEAIVPVAFLVWFLISWPLGSIYFAMFDPDVAYSTTSGTHRPMLEGNLRVQAVSLLFFVSYLATVVSLLPRRSTNLPTFPSQNPATKRMIYVATGISFAIFVGITLTKVIGSESALSYFLFGSFLYLSAVPVIIGVLLPKVPRPVLIVVLSFFAVTSFFYLLYNSRTYVVLPWVMILFGMLFFSEWPQRKKLLAVLTALIVFPLIVVIGDTTRNIAKGRLASLEQRQEALSHWQDWLSQGSVVSKTMGRFFSTGGHSIITLSPDQVPYLDLSLPRYVGELVVGSLIPAKVYNNTYYSTPYHLNSYGILVNQSTSVELSLPGSLWMLGGWLPVGIGGIAVGLLHSGLIRWLRAAIRRSPYQGLFYFAVTIGVVIWGFNLDLISHTRVVVRGMVFAWALWHLIVQPALGPTTRAVWAPLRRRLVPVRI